MGSTRRVTLTYHQRGDLVQDFPAVRSGWRVAIPGSMRTYLVACHNDPTRDAPGEDVDGPSAFPDVFLPYQSVEVEVASGITPPPGRWHRLSLDEEEGNMLLTRSTGERFQNVPFTEALGDALMAAEDSVLWVRRAP